MTHRTARMAIVAVMSLVVIIIVGLVWTRTVEVRVPDEFHGLIRVRADPGAAPPSVGFFRLVVRVPASGELAIRDLDVICRWHYEFAVTFSGSRLPTAFPGDSSHTGVAFHIMNTPPTPQVFYYVGTQEELLSLLAADGRSLYAVGAQ